MSPTVKGAALPLVRELAEKFADEHLTDYLRAIEVGGWPSARKEINDPLWGTIGLTPHEVALLDSPLIQRMRSVRQLGVVHWVYPGAVHTRFEHSLGVLHQVQHLVSALNTLGQHRNRAQLIDVRYTDLLRLCALLHDVGHSSFSHVLEKALQSLPEMQTISSEFALEFGTENKQISEIFAYYIVKSPAMASFLDAMLEHFDVMKFKPDRKPNVAHVADLMGRAIIGQKISDSLPLLHELISGPFDADKLDYFARDAKMAGIPSLLDISRLVQKIAIRELDAASLPNEIAKQVSRVDGGYILFGMKWSGIAVLDELHLSRVLLYAKIYRHPKVLAVEQMLKAVVENLAIVAPIKSIIWLIYNCDDDQLLKISRTQLIELLGIAKPESGTVEDQRLGAALSILKAVQNRQLYVRAVALQRRYPADPLERDETQKEGLSDLQDDFDHPQKRLKLKQELLGELNDIMQRLGLSDQYDPITIESLIGLQSLSHNSGGTQIARAFLLPADGKPMPFRDYIVNRAAWADSYTSDLSSGYIFSSKDLADHVYLAFQKLARTKYNIKLPDSAAESSKRDRTRLQALKVKLGAEGYYKDAPYDLRPLPKRLERADIEGEIRAFVEKAGKYQAPTSTQGSRYELSLASRTFDWLRQFDDNAHIECALSILRNFKMLERKDTVDAIRTFIEKNPEFRGAIVIPFGSVRDSGSVQTYFSADLIPTFISACMTLDEAVSKGGTTPVIIIDDFVASGGQGQDILAAGFDEPALRIDLGEDRQLFQDRTQEYLRAVKIGFVFTAAWADGIRRLKEVTGKLGLNAIFYSHIGEENLPFTFDLDLEVSADVQESFKTRCAEIGAALLRSMKEMETGKAPTTEDNRKIARRNLGHGNRAMLLASPFNVPSQTLTAIWGEGTVDGVEWAPLLARRKKH